MLKFQKKLYADLLLHFIALYTLKTPYLQVERKLRYHFGVLGDGNDGTKGNQTFKKKRA